MWPTLRDHDLARQQAIRRTSIGNGLIVAVGGVLMMVMVVALSWDEAARDGWGTILGTWQFWALTALFVSMTAAGLAMFLHGRRREVKPNLALPTHADLPDFDPRRSIPLGHRRLYSAIVGIGGLAACLGCVFLAAAAPDWVGQWPRFFLFFGGPLVTLAFARVVGHALTGDDRYPRR